MTETDTGPLRVFAQGYWLPAGRSNFYNGELDSKLVSGYNAYDVRREGPLAGYDFGPDQQRFPEHSTIPYLPNTTIPLPPSKLETSIYSRLVTVLTSGYRPARDGALPDALRYRESKRYSRVFPMYGSPLYRISPDSDVDAAAFVCTRDDLAAIPEWQALQPFMRGLALFVVADGFYVWLALYHGFENQDQNRERAQRIEEALTSHIQALVGGNFYNRSANRGNPPDDKGNLNEETVTTYRTDNLGILTYFQINLIFEGLWNYNLDPRIFFDAGAASEQKKADANQERQPTAEQAQHEHQAHIDIVKQGYSIGTFIAGVTVPTEVAPKRDDLLIKIIEDLTALFDLKEDLAAEDYYSLFERLRKRIINTRVRRDLLRQFLRTTSTDVLHILKLRMESCGRLLLQVMIKIAHLRQPLAQTEIPETTNTQESRQARFNIPVANEGQLRGYVVLLASKLPLIENVGHYLDSALTKLDEMQEQETSDKDLQAPASGTASSDGAASSTASSTVSSSVSTAPVADAPPRGVAPLPPAQQPLPSSRPARKTIAGLERSWRNLLASIKDNISGLQQAIDLAYKDEMLHETERMRAEEETLAEIERIRERNSGDFSPAANLTVSVIGNVIAFGGVIAFLVLAGPQFQGLLPLYDRIQQGGVVAIILTALTALLGVIAAVVVLYFLLHVIADPLIRFFTRWRQRRIRGEEQYYYEMDLRLDVPTDERRAMEMLAGNFATPLPPVTEDEGDHADAGSKPKSKPKRHTMPRVDRWHLWPWWNHRPQRNSYRVNRGSEDEASHKVYIAASILWPRRVLPTPWFARKRLRVYLVYEILFHKPSDAQRYELKTLRIVTVSRNLLKPPDLDNLLRLLIGEFINRWIAEDSPVHERLRANDAALALVKHV